MALHPSLEQLRATLQSQSDSALTDVRSSDLFTPSAVLILLYLVEQQPHLVLTLRPLHMKRHAGQISLPGGRYDPEDRSLLVTALRETEEELGVPPSEIDVWGALEDSIITVSQYRVTPFVGFAERRPTFRPNPLEVAEVVELPLHVLMDASSMREELWDLRGQRRLVSFYPWGPHKIWGATARVLAQLARVLDADARQPVEL